ncbi:Efflux pump periplasmic linker BepF [Anatilimnocola aggregata]|uniref:Efflux pump periplasmic linker BepF n=1 Tax=Anatilimnocola aggregata TaxID=2528021 RepID=A0A517YHT0_9BACT|nr:efflux RND transporter periplasmic adaptor subunit [Anatilimnocola aggregata]QDU29765.1 Efflux pump periplasmic linker BepF [Anatilimnocola aggregata]
MLRNCHPLALTVPTWPLHALLLGSLLVACGCQPVASKPQAKKLAEVFIAKPTTDEVTDFEEFTGHLVAQNTVAIRSRVSGYLDKVEFKDGADVKKGELLFVIDDRSYVATAANAKAMLDQAKSRLANLKSQDERAQTLLKRNAIPSEESEKLSFQRSEAEAAVAAAEAQKDLADLNVTYTKITSPIDGVINNRQVDVGNLVKFDDTILATVVSQDPIYAYFDVNERTVLKLRRLINAGQIESAEDEGLVIQVSLADEDDFKHSGKITFLDNQLDANTGTLRVRAEIENKNGFLSPGLFVRVRFPVGKPHEALLVQEEALGTDQGQRFLYVLNDKDEVAYRRVKVGLLDNGRRVIEVGLKPGERVVVNGLQRIRPGDKVAPKDIPGQIAGEGTQPKVTLVSEKAAGEATSPLTTTQPSTAAPATATKPLAAEQRH